MLRGLVFFLKLAVLVAVAVWLAEQPGRVIITWLGYQVETSVGILLLAVAIVAVLAALTYRFWGGLLRAPRGVAELWRGRRRRHGYRAITQGMVAVAAGEPEEARRFARKADDLLDDPPLTMLLSAQAAQLNGDEDAAGRYFQAMLENPETRFLGLRGLLRQAQQRGDTEAALEYARQAYDIRPDTAWVLWSLFDLGVAAGQYGTALDTVRELQRANLVSRAQAARRRAVVLTQRARESHARGELETAGEDAREAVKEAPEFSPAAAIRARVLLDQDHPKQAARVIERAWSEQPHPELAALYRETRPGSGPGDRYQALRRLADRNPGHATSERVLGEAALEAGEWGKARQHLERAAGEKPTEQLCRLMAELEERENDDRDAARHWLRRAADAPRDPAWTCTACGTIAREWTVQCPHCTTFDGLAWQGGADDRAGASVVLPGESGDSPGALTQDGDPAEAR